MKNIETKINKLRKYSPNGVFYIPDYTNSVIQVKEKILQITNHSKKIVVYAFDSVNIFQFIKHFQNRLDLTDLELLSSVYPTGSPTAFSSIFYGKPLDEHNIFGIAFYSKEHNGIIQTNKDCIVDSYNNPMQKVDLTANQESFINKIDLPKFYIHTDNVWYGSNLWKSFAGNSNKISIPPERNYKEEYDRKIDLDRVLEKTEDLLQEGNDKFIWSSIDLDEHMHRNGVETDKTQGLLDYLSRRISNMIDSNPGYEYLFISDHGQIDLKDNYPFDFTQIVKHCYAARGGIGRTSYFYSKDEKAFDIIKDQVGETGLVLWKSDPIVETIFGFDPTRFHQIGDIIAIATQPSFPSYGWDFKAEHGALSKEELFVPFLHLKSKNI